MSAWTQRYVRPAINPWVTMGVPALLSQQALAAPAASTSMSIGDPAPTATTADPSDTTSPTYRLEDDPNYQARVAAILRQRDTSLADIARQRGEAAKAYGIGDTSDPFSRAKLLQESFDKNKASTGTTLAARGQLYSGALQNAQEANQHNFSVSQDSLQKAYQAAINSLTARATDVTNAAESDKLGMEGEALSRLLATRPDADVAGAAVDTNVQGVDLGDAPIMQTGVAPKNGYSFVAKSGPRKGQSYNVKKVGNKTYHYFANGTKVRVA